MRTIIALALLSLAVPAWAQRAVLPPPEYDVPYPGKLSVVPNASEAEIRRHCPTSPFRVGVLGCAVQKGASEWVLYIAPEDVIQRWGFTLEQVLRHERGHANGWPADHRNAR